MKSTRQEFIEMRQELIDDLKRPDINPIERLSYRCQIAEMNAVISAIDVKAAFVAWVRKQKARG